MLQEAEENPTSFHYILMALAKPPPHSLSYTHIQHIKTISMYVDCILVYYLYLYIRFNPPHLLPSNIIENNKESNSGEKMYSEFGRKTLYCIRYTYNVIVGGRPRHSTMWTYSTSCKHAEHYSQSCVVCICNRVLYLIIICSICGDGG